MTQPNYNALSPNGTDPSTVIAERHLAGLFDLEKGAGYDMSVDGQLIEPGDIGLPAEQLDPATNLTTKFNVVGEFSLPDSHDEHNRINGYKHLAVVAAKTSHGQSAFLLVGLRPDVESGKMVAASTGSPECWIHPGNPTVQIGRGEGSLDPRKLWGENAAHDVVTSKRHIVFSLQPNGTLRADTLGSNGTKGNIGRELPHVAHIESKAVSQSPEMPSPNMELRFQAAEKDPAFQQISEPYEAMLRTVDDKYAAEVARLRVEHEHDQRGGRSREAEISAARTQLHRKIEAEKAPIRAAYEAAVKPYFKDRLNFFAGDKLPGYAHPAQVVIDRLGAKSPNGKQISKYDQYASNGSRAKFTQDGVFPRFGQLLIDARGSSAWGASWTAEKRDDRTGQKTTSAQRAIDLAAAMVAGTFTGSDDPIQYRRATYTDFAQRGIDLPEDFLAKVPIYKVTSGIHRTIAERLIAGNDAVFQGEQLDR